MLIAVFQAVLYYTDSNEAQRQIQTTFHTILLYI
jgi:hypothetical protein